MKALQLRRTEFYSINLFDIVSYIKYTRLLFACSASAIQTGNSLRRI